MPNSLVAKAIADQPAAVRSLNEAFLRAQRPHALLITNHGYAGPTFPAGAPDSGGQITYVNHLARLLAAQGYKVSIESRAFVPDEHFASFGDRRGVAFMDEEPLVRYVFVPGIEEAFIPKEQIYAELPAIAHNLAEFIAAEAASQGKKPWEYVAWINTHYVDAGTIGQLVIKRWQIESGQAAERINRHAFTPHSLGKLKETNMLAMDEELKQTELFRTRFAAMSFPLREHLERALVGSIAPEESWLGDCPPAAALVTTSAEITSTLAKLGAPADLPVINFPPGTDVSAYHPRESIKDREVQELLAYLKDIVPAKLVNDIATNPQKFNVIVEAGRMDATKRKEIAIGTLKHLPENTLLFITGKRDKAGVYDALKKLIVELKLEGRAFLLGMVPDELMAPLMSLPHGEREDQLRLTIGVSASRMEGWGMAAMDMTAGGYPLVASPLVPYATHLKGQDPDSVVIVPLSEDEPRRYAEAFKKLIDNPANARKLASKGYKLAQAFDWSALVKNFVGELGRLFGT